MTTSKLEAALEHARAGRAVFPLQWIRPDGSCSCGGRDGCKPGKHPQYRKGDYEHGLNHATTDESQIRIWWKRWPEANIGVATGSRSGFWVLDVDPRHGGDERLLTLELEYSKLPRTPEQKTVSCGRHICFSLPEDFTIRNSQKNDKLLLGSGLDIRGEGGYIVGSGSTGKGDSCWQWDLDRHPDDLPFTPAPEWLLNLVKGSQVSSQSAGKKQSEPTPQRFPHGRQHEALVKYAGRMRRSGASENEIYAALSVTNRERCEIPGPEGNMRQIAASVARYPAADPVFFNDSKELHTALDEEREPDREEFLAQALESKRSEDHPAIAKWINLLADSLWCSGSVVIGTWTKRVVESKLINASAFKVAIKEARSLRIKEQNRESVDENGERKQRTAKDSLEDPPDPDAIIPDPYYVADTATLRREAGEDGLSRLSPFALSPILVTARMRDANDGSEFLRLSWKREVGWLDRTVGRSDALNSQKLIELASFGFPVASDNSKDIVRYIRHFEAANMKRLPTARVSSHLGWQGKDGELGFLWGRVLLHPDGEQQGSVNIDELSPEDWREDWVSFHTTTDGANQLADGFKSSGTLEEWKNSISVLRDYPRALFILYSSFCPPLLQIVGAPNFVLDVAGRTTIGKTTMLRAAGSVWGDPDERGDGVVGCWDSTKVRVERSSEILSSLPLLMDDTKQAKTPKIIADLLYTIANGRGRGRGNVGGLARTGTWRTIMISTGESPATSFTQDGGTRTRCLELLGSPFGEAVPGLRKIVDHLNLSILKNYGFAGPLFIRHLQKNRDSWTEYKEKYQEYVEAAADQSETVEGARLAPYGAVVLLAAEIAHEVLGFDWDPEWAHSEVWEGMVTGATDAAGEIRALADIISWAHSHDQSFYGRHQTDSEGTARMPPQGWSGRWDPGDDWEFIAIFPTVLNSELKRLGYEPQAIIPSWKERGWLDTDSGCQTKRVRIADGSPRCISILRAAVDQI